MDFLELARQRKSVRGFLSRAVPDEIVMAMLEAAVQSPSGGNCQPWHFYAVRERSVIGQLHERAYRADWFLSAPVVFVVCLDAGRSERYGERGRTLYSVQDTGAAIQSMLLCAKSLGVDTCWCGAFDEAAAAEILGMPENLRPVALIPTGYGASSNPKPVRRPMSEAVTFVGEFKPPESAPEEYRGIRFERANMGCAVFDDVNLAGASFNNINLSGASFSDANMTGAAFGGLCLNNAAFGCVDMQNAPFENTNLNGSVFENCRLTGLKITNCDFTNTEIAGCDITGLKINGVLIEELLDKA